MVIHHGQEWQVDLDGCRRLLRRVQDKIDKLFKARLEGIWAAETETGDYPEFCALEIEKQALWYMK
jgi:hypothetical protein